MPISAVIITFNEERNIQRCIDSLRDVADEIIVIDSFSTDKTKSICEQNKVTFIQTDWKGYSATKNFGHTRANSEWILSMDADEALSDSLKKEIVDAKKSGLKGAYRFPRLTNYCGTWIRHGGWYPDKKIRLFNRNEARWEGSFVHEELVVKEGVSITELKGDLLHYSYYTIEEHLQRSEKYAKLGAEKIAAKGKGVFLKSIFSPVVRFIQMYFFKAGFLDGYHGFKIAAITAREVRLKYKGAEEILNSKT